MATFNDDIYFATIPDLNRRLKAKEFSAQELVEGFATRLETLGPRYNAVALPLVEPARQMVGALDIDGDIKRERFRGMLQGIPYGAKDLLAFKGHPTTWGAKPYAGQVFDYNATAIEKLTKTSSVLVGKLSMVELAGGGGYRYASASLQGPGRNPWDRNRWSGGSSSGSGAAVVAGLVPFALGSETSGSIVTPAAYCGVTALRPTYGLVSRYGAMALSWTLDKIGPFCRSAEDCGFVLQEISGGDSKDPGSAGKSFYYTPQFARQMKDIRVGFAPVDFAEWAEPETRAPLGKAFEDIKATGVMISEVKLPDFPYGAIIGNIISTEGSTVFEELITSGRVDELADQRQIAGLKAGLEIQARDYLRAMRIRRLVQEELAKVFAEVDVIVAPARPNVATPIDEPLQGRGGSQPRPKDPGMTSLIPAGNLAGLPALCLPCGFAGNLPVGLQLVGRPYLENTLIALGKAFQERTDWHRRRPPM